LIAAAPEAEREKHLKRLDRSLAQLTDLVNDSLIEAQLYGEPQLNVERVAARELVRETCDDLADQIAERNLRVETKVADFLLDADPKLLGSAVLNVLRNAVKFSRDGGRIAVETRQADGRALFDFKDQCGGIPADFMPRLFEPFVVARSAKGGSGLGLLIVKQAVEAHGGSVDVDNHPGEGCTFTLNLPCRQEP
jgi:signal transduction histidine kinase